eukprot:CAMPEP_0184489990 /NCGR_PEP_ID=MMETSP0113_2-20130426/16858_1 /TAXON_ID=91329 /ORGANISM="Norrisiella sphaerica, Strain BC52" /LENGTH=359 /DNA_ID=CAMNT_0026873703 /DNA_START=407 /DNA_END=1486 /DNA_ORIENTATION=-
MMFLFLTWATEPGILPAKAIDASAEIYSVTEKRMSKTSSIEMTPLAPQQPPLPTKKNSNGEAKSGSHKRSPAIFLEEQSGGGNSRECSDASENHIVKKERKEKALDLGRVVKRLHLVLDAKNTKSEISQGANPPRNHSPSSGVQSKTDAQTNLDLQSAGAKGNKGLGTLCIKIHPESSKNHASKASFARKMELLKSNPFNKGMKVFSVNLNGKSYRLPELRAKYCRQTRNVIERFDHFCPWIGNAVGLRNYHYFFMLILVSSFLASMITVSSVIALILLERSPGLCAVIATIAVLAMLVLLALSNLLVYNLRIVSLNLTTNEDLKLVFHGRENPHDRGCLKNWANVFCSWKRSSYYSEV